MRKLRTRKPKVKGKSKRFSTTKSSKKFFYIATSIPYTNAKPHIGHALEFTEGDVYARWNRLLGKKVFFLIGTDEHGLKNQQAAEKAGKPVEQFVDENVSKVALLAKELNLSNNDFIRTTDKERHYPTAQEIWKRLKKSKDLYKKKYSGLYCTGCESFKNLRDLVDGICPLHNKKPDEIEEENWFFFLSKYTGKIIRLIESGELEILPEGKKSEMLSFLKEGLEDVSFSRSTKTLTWGVPVPGDKGQVMYVWCDALTNYLSGIGFSSDKKLFAQCWPQDLQILGKDILRFHAILWEAMLLSAGLPTLKKILTHGFVTIEGQKMSKTIGNVIDPVDYIKEFGAEALRHYLLREIPSDEDGNFSRTIFIERYNKDLADNLGNLLNRSLTLAEKYFSGIPKAKSNEKIALIALETREKVEKNIENFKLHLALGEIFSFTSTLNNYINETEPWKVQDKNKLAEIIYTLLEGIRFSAALLSPFLPATAEKIYSQLGLLPEFNRKQIDKFGVLKAGKLGKKEILFKKYEPPAQQKTVETGIQASWSDFEKLEIVSAEILSAEKIEGADKLLKLTVNSGEKKTIVAGIAQSYSPEELIGKQVILLKNLAPREYKKFGLTSEAMLLAVGTNEGKLALVVPEKKVKPGERVG
ncbi:MAG: methionine--tRNA ligase [Candidatus Aenigmarchaeota archaeon]|nr:methionine--tRNA ligase [Candidatus Aenigmarchaeota archaeon]